MAAMADNHRSQASKATGQCLQRYLAATMHIVVVMFGRPCICCLLEKCFDHCVRSFSTTGVQNSGMNILLFNWMLNNGQLGEISSCV